MQPSEQQLMWEVQALAQPADMQPTLFPPFVLVADELALEFDHSRRVAEGQAGASWSPGQRAAVAALDRLLCEMSGPGNPELWLDANCLRHPCWSDVRELAQAALFAFGWLEGLPPEGRLVYIPG